MRPQALPDVPNSQGAARNKTRRSHSSGRSHYRGLVSGQPCPLPCMSSVYVLTQANRLKVSFCTRMSCFSTIVGFSGTIPVNCGVSMNFHDKSMRQ